SFLLNWLLVGQSWPPGVFFRRGGNFFNYDQIALLIRTGQGQLGGVLNLATQYLDRLTAFLQLVFSGTGLICDELAADLRCWQTKLA
ncbi:hypothetical protein L0P10_16055, partial [Eggerthella lenta]|nr:hypothetical protein [Eggerthella lenta]